MSQWALEKAERYPGSSKTSHPPRRRLRVRPLRRQHGPVGGHEGEVMESDPHLARECFSGAQKKACLPSATM